MDNYVGNIIFNRSFGLRGHPYALRVEMILIAPLVTAKSTWKDISSVAIKTYPNVIELHLQLHVNCQILRGPKMCIDHWVGSCPYWQQTPLMAIMKKLGMVSMSYNGASKRSMETLKSRIMQQRSGWRGHEVFKGREEP